MEVHSNFKNQCLANYDSVEEEGEEKGHRAVHSWRDSSHTKTNYPHLH